MADDQIDYSPSPTATTAAATDDDDSYSMNTTDDYWRYKKNYQYHSYYDNDDRYYSTKHTTSWLDNLLYNTTAGSNSLEAAVDVNPDNVLATLILNIIACVILLSMYEILRRCIPSVYSQRLMNAERVQGSSVVNTATAGYNNPKNLLDSPNTGAGTNKGRASTSKFITTTKDEKEIDQQNVDQGDEQQQNSSGVNTNNYVQNENNTTTDNDDDDDQQQQHQSSCTQCHMIFGWKTCNMPILEWALPIFATPWSTFRELAGLDAYFYLRYIRLCLKITSVSSFWAIIILCPVYATGGGAQTGFYHYSMANVLQEDKGRVWVPTIFCWTFTMYCWFCVRSEMAHYVELRMQFLGGEEEEKILRQRESLQTNNSTGGGGGGNGYSYGAPQEIVKNDSGIITAENTDQNNSDAVMNSQELDQNSSRSKSPLLATALADLNDDIDDNDGGEDAQSITTNMTSYHHPQASSSKVHKEMKQHRYSLQIEKVPVALRSNTALFNYFNDIFPNQVHSACITMNIPDLDAMSARRMRVCRRLEKSLAYYNVTGIRPTHIAGRPRCQCLGIESTPIDGWCVACCCFYDSCKMHLYDDDDDEFNNGSNNDAKYPDHVYDNLPDKGERVDSIMYYTCDLADSNVKMKKLQKEKFRIAETGRRADGGIIEESNCDWYAHPLSLFKEGAATAAEGLREEFEVVGEDDYFGGSGVDYGSMSSATHHRAGGVSTRRNNNPKREPLMQDDHLSDADQAAGGEAALGVPIDGECDGESTSSSRRKKTRYRSRPYTFVRSVLWQMGVDFLAAGLDEVRNRTDVVVNSVTRPSMSSTGFVTFKTLTPVTVTTSAPLTYNRDPMQVSIAPEPRDLVWQNVQIDADIVSSRAFLANVLLGLGVLLWSIPLTFIQAWAKVENVALIPGLEWVAEIHGGAWKSLINGYLPVVALLGLICVLPFLFNWVATSYEKRKTLSGVQNSIVGRYFYYQLANIYITVSAGAIWTSLADIIDHPQQLLVILGETLPKLAGYFISLLITKTLAGLPIVLCRLGALSRMMFLRSCFNKRRLTQRELKEVYRKQPIYYGWEYPTQFLVIIICFTYACITPFVLFFGSAYFFAALLVYKKQALYVYTPTYESGGRMFPQAVSKTLFALLISQLTFIGYSLIRKAVFQIILLAPLPFLTAFFHVYIQDRYVEPSKNLSLERAVKIDALSDEPHDFSVEAYQQPVLTEKTSVPVCLFDEVRIEVLQNLDRLQNNELNASSSSVV